MTEIREIYNRRPDDPNYAGDYVLEHNDIEEEIISQVKMLLSRVRVRYSGLMVSGQI